MDPGAAAWTLPWRGRAGRAPSAVRGGSLKRDLGFRSTMHATGREEKKTVPGQRRPCRRVRCPRRHLLRSLPLNFSVYQMQESGQLSLVPAHRNLGRSADRSRPEQPPQPHAGWRRTLPIPCNRCDTQSAGGESGAGGISRVVPHDGRQRSCVSLSQPIRVSR